MSFEAQCGVLGIDPRVASMCETTAAGPGGAIVPVRAGGRFTARTSAAPAVESTYFQDEKLAMKLQQEENDLAARTDASVEKDAKMAASMTNTPDVKHRRPAAATAADSVAVAPNPSASPSYRPGAWGNRFAALA
ncbi:unnamed protein product, partial [Laminaria digitata]